MRKVLFFVFGILLIYSCSKENTNTMYVRGNIKGLKKGTLYLQKQKDSLIVSVDSIHVIGTDEFLLTDEVTSPEMYFLTLGNGNKKIAFFGEKDSINIFSRLDKFEEKAKITGSKNQELLNEYLDMKKKFNSKNLDLIKEEFEARKSGIQDSVEIVAKKLKSLNRRKYLYTTNFAVSHANYEVAPYIALTELENANIKLLDTVNSSLSSEIKKSKYGKQLDEFIADIKSKE
jgi:Domain of unknown function (DUF4369)